MTPRPTQLGSTAAPPIKDATRDTWLREEDLEPVSRFRFLLSNRKLTIEVKANYPYLIDPVTAITAYVKTANPAATVQSTFLDYDLDAAAALAKVVEKCLVFVTAFSQEGTDRTNISIYHGGDELINAVASNCANTAVSSHS